MKPSFLLQTTTFLANSDIEFDFPKRGVIALNPDGTHTFFYRTGDFNHHPSIKNNELMSLLLFFALFDAFVDNIDSSLEGLSFKKKYVSLPSTTDRDIIIKELFRFLRVLRNAMVHNPSGIDFTVNSCIVNRYSFRKYSYESEISKAGLVLIYSLIVLLIDSHDRLNEYTMSILRSYFDDILEEIHIFNDDFGNGLGSIGNGRRLKRKIRNRIVNATSIKNDTINIIRYQTTKEQQPFSSADYIFDYNKKKYLIPDEILSSTSSIQLSDIKSWEYLETEYSRYLGLNI